MNKGQVEKAERLALNEFDKWNDVTGVFGQDTGYYYEITELIKDAVHVGIQMAVSGKVVYNKDKSVKRL